MQTRSLSEEVEQARLSEPPIRGEYSEAAAWQVLRHGALPMVPVRSHILGVIGHLLRVVEWMDSATPQAEPSPVVPYDNADRLKRLYKEGRFPEAAEMARRLGM